MEPRRVAPVLGLCALLAADALLIGWAFRGTPAETLDEVAARAVVSSPAVSPTGRSAVPKVAPLSRFVAPVSADAAWVVDAGSCGEPGTIRVTTDGGRTWSREKLPGRALRAKPSGSDGGWVAGGDDGCDPRMWTTTEAGASWGRPDSAATAWFRMPDDARRVHTPTDKVVTPCGAKQVVDLAVVDGDRGRVVCAGGEVRFTRDGGRSWTALFTEPTALATAVVDSGTGVLVRTSDECEGVEAVALAKGRPTKETSCVEADVVAGRVSVGTAGDGWWLVVGNEVFRAKEASGPWKATATGLGKG